VIPAKITDLGFGSIMIDGETYTKDIMLDHGKVEKRKKKPSKKYRDEFGGHTPLTTEENISWECEVLVVGIGHDGALPIAKSVMDKAQKKGVELKIFQTPDAIEYLNSLKKSDLKRTNAILHLTC